MSQLGHILLIGYALLNGAAAPTVDKVGGSESTPVAAVQLSVEAGTCPLALLPQAAGMHDPVLLPEGITDCDLRQVAGLTPCNAALACFAEEEEVGGGSHRLGQPITDGFALAAAQRFCPSTTHSIESLPPTLIRWHVCLQI